MYPEFPAPPRNRSVLKMMPKKGLAGGLLKGKQNKYFSVKKWSIFPEMSAINAKKRGK